MNAAIWLKVASITLDIIAAYVLANIIYNLWLLFVAIAAKTFSRKDTSTKVPSAIFCVLIPAHNEEAVVSLTLESLAALDYPIELVRIVLIADNCTDRTAEVASRFDSVRVLVRENQDLKSKGHALNWAIDRLKDEIEIDCFVIVDADTLVDQNFLVELDRARQRHLAGRFVAQGRYDVANPDASWRTSLMAGALSLVHVVRPLARERLSMTVGLKGNGMCFDRSVVYALRWPGDSLTEDVEYTLDLLEQMNIRVVYVPYARVAALMPVGASASESQRNRWESGRAGLVRYRAARLLTRGLRSFKPSYIDAAFDLLAMPLAQLAAAYATWAALIALYGVFGGPWHAQAALALFGAISLLCYILGGFAVGDAPPLAYRALLFAPFYTVWKLALRMRRQRSSNPVWVRTSRECEAPEVKN